MKANVGEIDRVVRIGVVPLLTGVFRFCPAYLPFGLNSRDAPKSAR